MADSNRGAYGQLLSTGHHQEMENIGKRIEALRIARGWSQTQAAKELGIKQPSLSDIEKGVTKTLRGETVANLCKVFHTTAEYIYYGSAGSNDPELPLVEAELIYMARSLTPDRRQTALDSIRGIFKGQPGSDKNDPFSGREPGDSGLAPLGGNLPVFHPSQQKPSKKRGVT